MAVSIIKSVRTLDKGFVLTPERYNPKRRLNTSYSSITIKLSEFIDIVSEVITPKQAQSYNGNVLIVNTGDAHEGHIKLSRKFNIELNSNKKIVKVGDVIISRLRPYLRQVAYVDEAIFSRHTNYICAVSTEFFVLRAKNKMSIAFLIPFLLSDEIQAVFANSVEGSQHPRFKEEDLLNLELPKSLVSESTNLSANVEKDISYIRHYEINMTNRIEAISQELKLGLSIEKISDGTGLSIEEIQKLKDN